MKQEPLTLDELIDWLQKLRKTQEGYLSTNVDNIEIREEPAQHIDNFGDSNTVSRAWRKLNIITR